MDERDFKKIEEIFQRHIGIVSENFQHRLDIVAEGYRMLSEKIDRSKAELETRIGCVERKLDIVAADLKAHREDTEVHKKVYKVEED